MSLTRTASFSNRLNHAMVKLEKVEPADGAEHADLPRQRSVSVSDPGMGDLLRFDAERLRILVERHLLHTGSARAKALLDNWDASLAKFVKVMPTDYAKALDRSQGARRHRCGIRHVLK